MKHSLSFTFLNWHITIGLSILALLFNFAYFFVLDHTVIMALKMSGSSLISIGAMHMAHSVDGNEKFSLWKTKK